MANTAVKAYNYRVKKAWIPILAFALLLGLLAAWYLRVPDHIEYKTLAPSNFMEIDGFKTHFVEAGEGSNLLLVHGFASSTYSWHKIWPLVADEFHVTAIDLPGFGLSDKPRTRTYTLDEQAARLGAFIERRGLAPVDILAWSMGAEISLWLAKNKPELVNKLVLVTPALHRDIVWLPINFAEWTAPFIAGWAVTPQAVELTYWRVFESELENKDEFTRQAYYPFHRSPDAFYSLIAAMKLMADPRNPDAFDGVVAPMRLLLSEKDKVIPLNLFDRFKEMYPHADVLVNSDGGHGLMIDEPEWVAEKAMEFFTAEKQ